MTIPAWLRTSLLGAGLGVVGCDRSPADAQHGVGSAATYEVRGVVRRVDREHHRAIIAHEAISGFMDAMAMEFAVPGDDDLARLQAGEKIAFRLSVTDRRSWIDRVQPRGVGELAVPPAPVAEGLAVGALVPDGALVDAHGGPLRLSDFKGRALALTFIFTRCPLPDFCPRLNEQFSAVQRELLTAGAGWHLLSISIDPAYDTPERLAAYAPRFHPEPTRWTFATGEADEIERLAGAFGLRTMRAGAELNHTLRTVVVDPAGRVQKIFNGNEWKVAELVAEMQRAMAAAAP